MGQKPESTLYYREYVYMVILCFLVSLESVRGLVGFFAFL